MVEQVREAVFEDLARVAAANEDVGMFEGRGDDGPEDGRRCGRRRHDRLG